MKPITACTAASISSAGKRSVLTTYLLVGTTVATLRVVLLMWVFSGEASLTVTPIVYSLMRFFYPEALLAEHTRLSVIPVSQTEALLIWGSILATGSFILSTPVLLLAWLRRIVSRRSR